MEKINSIQNLEQGDKILYEGKSKPLKVKEVKEDKVIIAGPLGGKYQLFEEEDAKHLLVSKPGNKDYASYAKNVRKIGEWIKKEEKYIHTDTEACVKLYKNKVGFWNVKVENIDADFDEPKYGFSNKEKAEEEASKIVEKNPEG